MGEIVFRDLVEKEGVGDRFLVDSSATSREEIGNGVYPPAARKLRSVGLDPRGHRARQFTTGDYKRFDYVLVMESYNKRNLMRIIGEDREGKVYRLLDFTDRPRDIDDPWYTDNFDLAYDEILEGCRAFLEWLRDKNEI